jgi:hypothetical protein
MDKSSIGTRGLGNMKILYSKSNIINI